MKFSLVIILVLLVGSMLSAQPSNERYFELRIYYCLPGRLDALIDRFQNHTTKLFEKHGMENIGYWVPINNEKNALYYILAYPDKKSRDASWAAFIADPEWKTVASQSEASGKIVASVTSVFMTGADILPSIHSGTSGKDRVFELRTYFCHPGRLPNLVKRFKDHTVRIFEKHHMENICYFISQEKEGIQSNLVYLLAHESEASATQSWTDFRVDADWVKARDASEKDGKIVEKVESVFLKPLPFSKIR